jgi:FOG: WD40 repeat
VRLNPGTQGVRGKIRPLTHSLLVSPQDIVITGSPDTHIRVWDVGTSQTMQLMAHHTGPITGLSIHPTGDYILSTAEDQSWAFSDIRSGRLLTQVSGFSFSAQIFPLKSPIKQLFFSNRSSFALLYGRISPTYCTPHTGVLLEKFSISM